MSVVSVTNIRYDPTHNLAQRKPCNNFDQSNLNKIQQEGGVTDWQSDKARQRSDLGLIKLNKLQGITIT